MPTKSQLHGPIVALSNQPYDTAKACNADLKKSLAKVTEAVNAKYPGSQIASVEKCMTQENASLLIASMQKKPGESL
jgi:hypothetical protein